MGKPFAQAKGEVAKCASGFRWFAEHAEACSLDEEVPVDASLGLIIYQPLGRRAGHHALELPSVAGDPVRRPGGDGRQCRAAQARSERAPGRAACWRTCSVGPVRPDGIFQTLLIGTDQVPAIIADPRVAAVTLTGSVGAGRAVAAQAGAVGKKIVLELGGSDPFIVLPSADVARAVSVGVEARVQNAGQSCIAAKRFIVHDEVAEEFTRRVRGRHGGPVGGRSLRSGHRGGTAGHRGGL